MNVWASSPAAPGIGVGLVLRRWLAKPVQMGSIVPSSPAPSRRVVQQVRRTDDEWEIEMDAGTGDCALLASGQLPECMTVVEIVPAWPSICAAWCQG